MAPMCPVCRQRSAQVGVLCDECQGELSSPLKIAEEQIQSHIAHPTTAALIDLWGRPHPLASQTQIGRQVDQQGLAILEASVSRQHGQIVREHGAWVVHDRGSANGTYLDDRLIERPTTLGTGARVRFGHIAFYFVEDVTELPVPKLGRTMTATLGPVPRGPSPARAFAAREIDDDDREEERTQVGLPTMRFKLHEPTGGGGGLVEVDGKQVQLTTTQFELMALMIRRMAGESHQPELVRGFVRSSELIADLSWDTREPSENHVKQLVRRVRRALVKSEIGDLIESRHRFGYRLRAIPRTE